MATLVLKTAGSFVGSFFGPWGSAIGSAVGAMAGNAIDQQLFAPSYEVEGPRLDGTPAMTAEEGVPIPRVYGTVRISSTVIWATRFDEARRRERQGGKSFGGGTTVTSYSYSVSFAVGLCEGPIAGIRRVWADGKELDHTEINFRLYRGTNDQLPDDLLAAKQGQGNVPAYRGLAYVVFEDLDLERFGNRVPQIEVEVIRCIGDLENSLTAISIIPGSTEHGLDPEPVRYRPDGKTIELNRHIMFGETDWHASVDELLTVAPNLKHASLVVSWFGDDLRAGECKIRPGIVDRSGAGETRQWQVSGRDRASPDVHVVSRYGDAAAYGGTPNDASVVAAIADLKQRGIAVTLNPFLLMDVPQGNSLPSPYNAEPHQPAYPWRGRITCFPARGETGSVERTAAARTQLSLFSGTTAANAFSTQGTQVTADSGVGWDYRTFILHYAHLAAAAGGIDTFVIGSELRGLTQVRDDADQFAFVEAMVALANDVRAILGPNTKITYGADWTEYFGFQPDDGSGNIYFHLDTLWASSSVDAVGIDMYAPLSDWRESDALRGDNPDGFSHHADRDAMKRQVESGEGFEWYYASDEARDTRSRTAITDGAYGKDWIFRFKDVTGWWSNPHYDRRAGVELLDASPWQPKSKPVFLLEAGCTALRGGAVQPNVFPDTKSSENARPRGATGALSDAEQRAFLLAHLRYWAEVKAVLGSDAPVDPDRIYAWAWDARPYPAFPVSASVWGDGDNWHGGHWLNGRLGTAPVSETMRQIFADFDASEANIGDIPHVMDGLVVAAPRDARSVLDPLTTLYDCVVRDDTSNTAPVTVTATLNGGTTVIPAGELAISENKPERLFSNAQRDEVLSSVLVTFRDPLYDYKRLAQTVRPSTADGSFQAELTAPGLMRRSVAQQVAHNWGARMMDRAASVEFELPMKWIGLQTGDLITFDDMPDTKRWVVDRLEIEDRIHVTARAYKPDSAYVGAPGQAAAADPPHVTGDFGSIPDHALLDLPASDTFQDHESFMAAAVRPASRSTLIYTSLDGAEHGLTAELPENALMGTLLSTLAAGPTATWDTGNLLEIEVAAGEFASVTDAVTLGGANLAAVEKTTGWEVIAFSQAEETAPGVWRLSRLLRGLGGTDDLVPVESLAGARFVLLDSAVRPVGIRADELGREVSLRVGESGRPLTDRYFASSVATPGMRARLPIRPVHLRAYRNEDGSLEVNWIRRARRHGDDWSSLEVPLDEDFERYSVTVEGAGNELVLEAQASHLSIAVPALLGAGIGLNDPLNISVAQISRAIGTGLASTVTIDP
ncbi:MAG: glycoside hydrolase/phage tail family protein [Pseudomonadota bacterium]